MKKLIACAVLISALFCSTAYAGTNIPSTVTIPVSYEVNEPVESDFILTALNGAPMPKGSSGDKKTVSRSTTGSVDFGEITFTSPDLYEYTISKNTEDKEGLTKDTSKYSVHIIATNEGQTSMIIRKEGSEEKPDAIIYRDYITTKPVGEKSVSDTPKAKKTVEGEGFPNDSFVFQMKAISGPEGIDPPMPEGKAVAEISLKNKEEKSFGTLTFKKPGEYLYEVIEKNDESLKNYEFDKTKYLVKYEITETDETLACKRTITADGKEVNATSLEFINKYENPTGGSSEASNPKDPDQPEKTVIEESKETPKASTVTEAITKSISKAVKTGDIKNPLILTIILLCAAGTAIFIIRRKKED